MLPRSQFLQHNVCRASPPRHTRLCQRVCVIARATTGKNVQLLLPGETEPTGHTLYSESDLKALLSNVCAKGAAFVPLQSSQNIPDKGANIVHGYDGIKHGGRYLVSLPTPPPKPSKADITIIAPGKRGEERCPFPSLQQQQLKDFMDTYGAKAFFKYRDPARNLFFSIDAMQDGGTYVLHFPTNMAMSRQIVDLQGVVDNSVTAGEQELVQYLFTEARNHFPRATIDRIQNKPFKDDATGQEVVQLDAAIVARQPSNRDNVLILGEAKSSLNINNLYEAEFKLDQVRVALPKSAELRKVLDRVTTAQVYVAAQGLQSDVKEEELIQFAEQRDIALVLPNGTRHSKRTTPKPLELWRGTWQQQPSAQQPLMQQPQQNNEQPEASADEGPKVPAWQSLVSTIRAWLGQR